MFFLLHGDLFVSKEANVCHWEECLFNWSPSKAISRLATITGGKLKLELGDTCSFWLMNCNRVVIISLLTTWSEEAIQNGIFFFHLWNGIERNGVAKLVILFREAESLCVLWVKAFVTGIGSYISMELLKIWKGSGGIKKEMTFWKTSIFLSIMTTLIDHLHIQACPTTKAESQRGTTYEWSVSSPSLPLVDL